MGLSIEMGVENGNIFHSNLHFTHYTNENNLKIPTAHQITHRYEHTVCVDH